MRHRYSGALYYDELLPDGPPAGTAVLVHGGSLTGACYLTTADDRPGWAHAFTARGYRVLVPDWPGTGRSASVLPDEVTGSTVCSALGRLLEEQDSPVVLVVHSMAGPFGFRLLSTHSAHITALVALAPGPPGDIQPEPAVLSETGDEIEIQGTALRWRVPKRGLWQPTEAFARHKLVGTSSRFPRAAFERFRHQLVPIPAGLLAERQNIRGAQLRIGDRTQFDGKPVLVMTGDHDTDHPEADDAATAKWLTELGADVTFRYLDDPAHTGNGHLLMSEDNSDTLAALVLSWLQQQRRPASHRPR